MGDHYRTRPAHTLKVAEIARTIRYALNLYEEIFFLMPIVTSIWCLMFLPLKKVKAQYNKYSVFINSLKTLYAAMDQKYKEAADYYGFHCQGCHDNCCLTRFYHYTLLEYLYILEGYNTLEPGRQIETKNRAMEVCRKTDEADEKGMAVRLMCPLNFDGLCILYDYRPMICRLHGIPHELQKADHRVMYSPGCEAFTKQIKAKEYYKFDRTPFYIKMAEVENELKKAAGITQKLKMTVAEMLVKGLRD